MESRKVQRVGQATLAVSLPNTWAKEHGVKQGDVITLKPERDGSLKLMPNALTEERRERNDCTVFTNKCREAGLLEKVVVSSYVLGRDTIRIIAPNRLSSIHTEEVRKINQKLTGLSIIEETSSQIILQCSIDPRKFPIHRTIRRLYILASTIYEESIQSLIHNNVELSREAIRRKDEADIMCWLTLRLLLSAQRDRSLAEKIGLENPLHVLGYRVVTLLLERVADWGKNMAKNALRIQESKKKVPKPVIDWLSKTSELSGKICSDAIQSLFSGDVSLSNTCIETYKKVVEPGQDKIIDEMVSHKTCDPQICPYLRCIIWGIERTGELGAEIAELAINKALESENKICEKASEDIEDELGRPHQPTLHIPEK